MKRPAGIIAIGLAAFLAAACGRKGPLQPPLARGPQAVEGLTAHQQGGAVILEWTNPAKSIDGRPLESIEAAEIWVLGLRPGEGKMPLGLPDFEARSRLGRRVLPKEFQPSPRAAATRSPVVMFAYPISGEKAGSSVMAFAVRILDSKKRSSKFSAPIVVETRVCPLPPEIQDVRVFKDRIEIDWAAPQSNTDGSAPAEVAGYNVYRAEGRAKPEKLTPSPIADRTFGDRRFSFGVPYSYVVRACAAGPDASVESANSAPRDVMAKDVFPPDPPAGLVALSGPGGISLSWDAGREEDIAGYRVWRKEEGGFEFVSLTAVLVAGNSFTDATAGKGKAYVYAVSAVDTNGNESPKTESGPVYLKGS
ncbi:MAG: LPS translocon maturation chaperone LptM [Candidatus Aminicenantales bacterium]